jgi:hypothetical protein
LNFQPSTKEIEMTTSPDTRSDLFYRALAAVVITASFLLVFAAGALPEDPLARGELIVYGHGAVVALAAIALLLRAVYAWGFRKAQSMLALGLDFSVTA